MISFLTALIIGLTAKIVWISLPMQVEEVMSSPLQLSEDDLGDLQ